MNLFFIHYIFLKRIKVCSCTNQMKVYTDRLTALHLKLNYFFILWEMNIFFIHYIFLHYIFLRRIKVCTCTNQMKVYADRLTALHLTLNYFFMIILLTYCIYIPLFILMLREECKIICMLFGYCEL